MRLLLNLSNRLNYQKFLEKDIDESKSIWFFWRGLNLKNELILTLAEQKSWRITFPLVLFLLFTLVYSVLCNDRFARVTHNTLGVVWWWPLFLCGVTGSCLIRKRSVRWHWENAWNEVFIFGSLSLLWNEMRNQFIGVRISRVLLPSLNMRIHLTRSLWLNMFLFKLLGKESILSCTIL